MLNACSVLYVLCRYGSKLVLDKELTGGEMVTVRKHFVLSFLSARKQFAHKLAAAMFTYSVVAVCCVFLKHA